MDKYCWGGGLDNTSFLTFFCDVFGFKIQRMSTGTYLEARPAGSPLAVGLMDCTILLKMCTYIFSPVLIDVSGWMVIWRLLKCLYVDFMYSTFIYVNMYETFYMSA